MYNQTIAFRFPEGPVTEAMKAADLSEAVAYSVCNLIEAAQCLWEALIDAPEGSYPGFDVYRWERGTIELRYALRNEEILAACSIGINLARDLAGFEGAYDWDFCPWFLAHCLTVEGGEIRLVPDWLERCATFGETGQ